MSEFGLSGTELLITGGAGFIGSHLARALASDNEVTVLDDLSTGRRERVPDAATFVDGDVRDQRKLKRATRDADVIFHQAGLVGVEQSLRQPTRSNHVNTGATVQLLDYARTYDTRVVLASSAAVYGHPDSIPVGEDDHLEPTSPYGVDKLAADHYARVFADRYDLPVVVLRYFNVYGPRNGSNPYSAVVETFLRQALAGETITVHGSGDQTRDFVHVDDVVRANALAATTDAVGRAYNVASGTARSIRALAELVKDITGTDSRIVHTEERSGDIDRSEADLTRAREQLGYEPTTTLESGLRSLIEDGEAVTPSHGS